MATEYNKYAHTHVTINHIKAAKDDSWCNEAWEGTHEIILHTGDRVWVLGCYMHLGHSDVIQVVDGQNKGFDEDGNCILSVPAAWCKYYSYKEAEDIEQCIYADAQLLSYAF